MEIKQGARNRSDVFSETVGIQCRYLSLFIDTIWYEVIIDPSLIAGAILAVDFQVFSVGYTNPV